MFQKNVGTIDGLIRIVMGLGMVAAGWMVGATQPLGLGLALVGAATAVTGLISRCSVYALLGISTRKAD